MNYIGIPYQDNGRSFKGADCWGAVYLYYRHEMGIELPLLSNRYENTRQSSVIESLVDENKPNWTKVVQPQEGDVIVFNIAGKSSHVGVCINTHQFIHAFLGTDSCIEQLDSPRWSSRIEGVYRYE